MNIFINFVPVIKEKDNNIKIKAYYKAIRIILKYTLYFSILTLYFIN